MTSADVRLSVGPNFKPVLLAHSKSGESRLAGRTKRVAPAPASFREQLVLNLRSREAVIQSTGTWAEASLPATSLRL